MKLKDYLWMIIGFKIILHHKGSQRVDNVNINCLELLNN